MSSLFIQVEQSLLTHRKTLRLARLLSLDRYAVIGRLVALWSWCLDNAPGGVLGVDVDADMLADVMSFDAQMGKSAELLEALLTVGFLELDEQTGALRIHGWYERMGRFIERREADAYRQRRSRAARAAAEADFPEVDSTDAEADVSPDVTPDDSSDAADVTRMSRGRHMDVTPQIREREEKTTPEKNIATGKRGSSERERARDAAPPARMAADAALSLAPSPASSTPPHTVSPASKVTPLRAPPAAAVTPAKAKVSAKVAGARVPDPVWDACIAGMGSPPTNSVERGRWAKGIKALRESLPDDPTALAAEIAVRSRRYRSRFGTSVPLNPMALAGNWSALSTDIDATSTARSSQEGRHHGRSATYGRSRSAGQAGRQVGGGQSGRPAFGTPEYYAQAATS